MLFHLALAHPSGSLFEFIDYFVFVSRNGLRVVCETDLLRFNPDVAEINFDHSKNFNRSNLYPAFGIYNLSLELPGGKRDFAWYSNLLVRHNTTRFAREALHTRFEVGQRMGTVLVPANLLPENDNQPLIPFLFRTIKEIELAGKGGKDIFEELSKIRHVSFNVF